MVCKVVPKFCSPTRKNLDKKAEDGPPETADYETALDHAGYGWFSRAACGACACAFFASGVQNCALSYVLPAARCDLRLATYQAGLINMAFMSGGVASAFFWGVVGDVVGRRNTLSLTLLVDAAVTLAQSAAPDYRLLLAARTLNGFVIGGPATLVFSYLSDLVGAKKRQLYLSMVGMSFVVAWLVLPAIAWVVLPLKASSPTILPIYSWRLFLALGSLPGFLAGLWVLFLPESPRLLADTNRGDKALKVLAAIYKANHRDGTEFKIKKLIQDDILTPKSLNNDENRTRDLFLGVLQDLKIFVSKAYAMKSTLILFMFFANMAAGFGLNMWIPELLVRRPGRECGAAAAPAPLLNATPAAAWAEPAAAWAEPAAAWAEPPKLYDTFSKPEPIAINATEDVCDDHMDHEVFTSGLIVGACCVAGNAACALLCARGGARGARRAAGACAGAAAAASACLAAAACACARRGPLAVAAAAALNAASLNGNVLLIRLLLHALPPKLSGLGVCWGAWWGRAGGVASNLAVGALLDLSCPAPFVAVAALLALSVGAIMVIKLEDQKEDSPDEDKTTEAEEKSTGLDRYISTYM